ncbi:TonB-dependent siderophore receptor [Massilia sp. CF038]|uniref:TonB-dependent receptor plug domain-containing protein n=1 Tax=Massilia sp. CF038 TaxID=1881045 RepID=UPI000934FF57|nr:TonB-dependent receptor [Massilia sp. CF038]
MTLPRFTLLAVVLSQSAWGQESTTTVPEKVDALEQVEVRARSGDYDPRRDDTASKVVVNQDEIVKYGDTSLLDVFKRIPGVTVSGGGGRGREVRMRGLGSGYTQILINGERAPAGFSLDTLAPDNVERIEVMRAATAEFSTQSIAGTINIVLKKVVRKAQRELKTGYTAARNAHVPNAGLQLSDRAGQLSYSIALNAYQSRSKRDSPGTEQRVSPTGSLVQDDVGLYHDEGTMRSLNLAPRLHWTFANGDTLTSQSYANVGRYSSMAQSDTVSRIGPAVDFPFVSWNMSTRSRYLRTDLSWMKKLDAGAKLDLKVGVSDSSLHSASARGGYDVREGRLLDFSDVGTQGDERGYTSTGKYSSPLGGGHALAMGWDGGSSRRTERRVETAFAGDPVGGYLPSDSDAHYQARIRRLAAYAQDEWNVTPRWSVYLGARWEGIFTDASVDTLTPVAARSRVWSPLFQTLYKLPDTKGDQLRLALTRTYRAPATQNLIARIQKSTNNSENEPDFIGNPALRPELALGLDAAYEHYWAEGAMVSVSASARQISDYTRQNTSLDGTRWVTRQINDGKAHTRGLEFDAKFPLNALVAGAPAIDVRANVSRNWSSVDAIAGPYNRLDAQTPISSTLGADYKSGRLTTGGSFSFRSGGPVQQSASQAIWQSARRELELYALWKFDQQSQLRVVVSNALAQDEVYENSYADAVRGRSVRRSLTPGEAALRLTLETKF